MRLVAQRVVVATGALVLAAAGVTARDAPERNARGAGPERHLRTQAEAVRALVLEGAARDFRHTVAVPTGFERCFRSGFARELTPETLMALLATHTAQGEPASARALNAVGVAVGDSCGGRRWVPELTSAAEGLRSASRGTGVAGRT